MEMVCLITLNSGSNASQTRVKTSRWSHRKMELELIQGKQQIRRAQAALNPLLPRDSSDQQEQSKQWSRPRS